MKQTSKLALLLSLLAWSCTSNKDQAPTTPDAPSYTLVFLDKTQSVNVNKAYVAEKYEQALTDILEGNMKNKGDKLEVYFIHENTAKAKALSLTVRSEKDDDYGASPTDKEAIETAYGLSLQKEKRVYLRQLLLKLNQQNTGASNQSTDILASIPIIAKANESGAELKVYYFSDMVESMHGPGRHDFHKSPPVSDEQAATEAKADAKRLEEYFIGTPQVTVISPFEPTASSREHSPHLSYYWQTLFQELGGVSVEEQ